MVSSILKNISIAALILPYTHHIIDISKPSYDLLSNNKPLKGNEQCKWLKHNYYYNYNSKTGEPFVINNAIFKKPFTFQCATPNDTKVTKGKENLQLKIYDKPTFMYLSKISLPLRWGKKKLYKRDLCTD